MRIRTHNLLLIMPIFVGVTALNGLFSYRGQLAEVRLGMAEGVESLAMVAAEMAAATLAAAGGGPVPRASAHVEVLREPFQRLLAIDAEKAPLDRRQASRHGLWIWIWRQWARLSGRPAPQYTAWERLRRLFWLTPDGARVLLTTGADGRAGPPLARLVSLAADGVGVTGRGIDPSGPEVVRRPLAAPPPDTAPGQVRVALLAAVPQHQVVYTDPFADSTGTATVLAYAPCRMADGGLHGLVGVEMDAAAYSAQRAVIGLRLAVVSGAMLLLGGLAVWYVSGAVARQLRELNTAARAAVAGDYGARVDVGSVQEVIDLGRTYNTMSSVLEEMVARTRRELIDGEQFRTETDLAREYGQLLWPPFHDEVQGVELAAQLASRDATGDFVLTDTRAGVAYVALGRVQPAGAMEAVTRASAAAAFLRERLGQTAAGDVCQELAGLLRLEALVVLRWYAADDHITSWSLESAAEAAGTPPGARVHALRPGAPLVFHTLPGEAGHRTHAYVELFAHLPLGQLMADLTVVAAAGAGGIVLLGRPAAVGGPEPEPRE